MANMSPIFQYPSEGAVWTWPTPPGHCLRQPCVRLPLVFCGRGRTGPGIVPRCWADGPASVRRFQSSSQTMLLRTTVDMKTSDDGGLERRKPCAHQQSRQGDCAMYCSVRYRPTKRATAMRIRSSQMNTLLQQELEKQRRHFIQCW